MRRTHTRMAAAITAVAAGGAAVYAMRPADQPVATLASKSPAVQYRTQVIRRTVHVIKHESGAKFPTPRGAVATGGHGPRGKGSVKTGASGSHSRGSAGSGSVAAAGSVVTRSSGSHASSGVSSGVGAPVERARDHPLQRFAPLIRILIRLIQRQHPYEQAGDHPLQRLAPLIRIRFRLIQRQHPHERAGDDPHQR